MTNNVSIHEINKDGTIGAEIPLNDKGIQASIGTYVLDKINKGEFSLNGELPKFKVFEYSQNWIYKASVGLNFERRIDC